MWKQSYFTRISVKLIPPRHSKNVYEHGWKLHYHYEFKMVGGTNDPPTLSCTAIVPTRPTQPRDNIITDNNSGCIIGSVRFQIIASPPAKSVRISEGTQAKFWAARHESLTIYVSSQLTCKCPFNKGPVENKISFKTYPRPLIVFFTLFFYFLSRERQNVLDTRAGFFHDDARAQSCWRKRRCGLIRQSAVHIMYNVYWHRDMIWHI